MEHDIAATRSGTLWCCTPWSGVTLLGWIILAASGALIEGTAAGSRADFAAIIVANGSTCWGAAKIIKGALSLAQASENRFTAADSGHHYRLYAFDEHESTQARLQFDQLLRVVSV